MGKSYQCPRIVLKNERRRRLLDFTYKGPIVINHYQHVGTGIAMNTTHDCIAYVTYYLLTLHSMY